jgi:hypothetical protein
MTNPNRPVTEVDFRMPEFRNAKPEDYEFRDDGKVVRKDRFKTGMYSVAYEMGFSSRNGFEIDDVVEAVRKMAEAETEWEHVFDKSSDMPDSAGEYDIRLYDGSILRRAKFSRPSMGWTWRDQPVGEPIRDWREPREALATKETE